LADFFFFLLVEFNKIIDFHSFQSLENE
jgi:hypothetical protein